MTGGAERPTTRRQRTRRPRRRWTAARVFGGVRSFVLTSFAVLGVACLVVFVGSMIFGVRPLVVVSGSMEPVLPVGSVVLSRSTPAAELEVGDIVTVERPRDLGLVTHRVVSATPGDGGSTELVLRGDANSVDDPEPYVVSSAGRHVWHVPGLGHVALFLQTGGGLALAGAIALVLLAVFVLDPARMGGGAQNDAPDDVDPAGENPAAGTRGGATAG